MKFAMKKIALGAALTLGAIAAFAADPIKIEIGRAHV